MSLSEFNLIDDYFKPHGPLAAGVVLGIGDDAAVVQVPPHHHLVLTMDTLVAGVHFPHDTPPHAIGHKALAVNLSDLAAMAAQPAWITLALTLPSSDPAWLSAFSQGLLELAQRHAVTLIGGDTTQGPLTITLQAHGLIPEGQAITRHQAQVGDDIYVTGTIGDAGLALAALQQRATLPETDLTTLLPRLNYPTPRLAEGLALRLLAHSMIDISDGLAADLSHILQQSQVGARLYLQDIPLSPPLRRWLHQSGSWQLPLTAGDDYELCFTAPRHARTNIAALPFSMTRIGTIEATPGLRCIQADGSELPLSALGYQHF